MNIIVHLMLKYFKFNEYIELFDILDLFTRKQFNSAFYFSTLFALFKKTVPKTKLCVHKP